MKTLVKEHICTRAIIVCLLALCMLLPSCRTESSKITEQETVPATDTSVAEFTESPSETLPEPSKTTEQETPAVSTISVDELKDKLEDGSPIMLVDIRNRDDFLTNHIKGAVSIPLDEIPDRYQEIPRDREVIVYADCA
jgi:PBP1b-binding outer membrane lipoprotein LpoB